MGECCAGYHIGKDVAGILERLGSLPRDRRAFVRCLFLHRRPSAVFGGVRAVVVDPLYGEIVRGSSAHVGQEVMERSTPPFADSDAPRSVVLKGIVARDVAAAKQSPPAEVFRGLALPVDRNPSLPRLGVQTPARPRVAAAKDEARNDLLRSAIAPTEPPRLVLRSVFGVAGEDCPAVEPLTGEGDKLHRLRASHARGPAPGRLAALRGQTAVPQFYH
jgi:hypothetical protein